ncbi:MAG TPA: sigma-70 family RNA polymerase sigma factor [Polyangiaceae bacterium]
MSLSVAMAATLAPEYEPAPFERVMAEHTPRVYRSLRYLGVPDADLPDASQEVFLVVYRRLEEFRGDASLSTWIYQICFRVARACRRRAASRRDEPVAELPVVMVDADQERAMQIEQTRHRLLLALDALPEDQRAVIVLHELEELPMSQVATLVGCPLFTAYSRHRLARKRLEESLTRVAAEGSHG